MGGYILSVDEMARDDEAVAPLPTHIMHQTDELFDWTIEPTKEELTEIRQSHIDLAKRRGAGLRRIGLIGAGISGAIGVVGLVAAAITKTPLHEGPWAPLAVSILMGGTSLFASRRVARDLENEEPHITPDDIAKAPWEEERKNGTWLRTLELRQSLEKIGQPFTYTPPPRRPKDYKPSAYEVADQMFEHVYGR